MLSDVEAAQAGLRGLKARLGGFTFAAEALEGGLRAEAAALLQQLEATLPRGGGPPGEALAPPAALPP